jgi:hypothetical protein
MTDNCPCKKKKCSLHGDCDACREHHRKYTKVNRLMKCGKYLYDPPYDQEHQDSSDS